MWFYFYATSLSDDLNIFFQQNIPVYISIVETRVPLSLCFIVVITENCVYFLYSHLLSYSVRSFRMWPVSCQVLLVCPQKCPQTDNLSNFSGAIAVLFPTEYHWSKWIFSILYSLMDPVFFVMFYFSWIQVYFSLLCTITCFINFPHSYTIFHDMFIGFFHCSPALS